jgi:two-component system LytT family sensor kinase
MKTSSLRLPSSQHHEWILHTALWTFVIAERWINRHPFAAFDSIIVIFTIIPLYFNVFFVIPSYFKKQQWLKYFAYLVGSIFMANVLRSIFILLYLSLSGSPFDFQAEFIKWLFMEYSSYDRFIFSPNTWIIYLSFAYMFIKDWITNERVKASLEAEKTSMELAFLKAQIDPHFLFNTLNNLYALALEEGAQRTSDAVTKMGALMRYNLHDSQADTISLSKEIDYLEKYIELQKLRLIESVNANIKIDFQLNNVTTEKIAPMILLPFLENAFKYGVSTMNGTFIEVTLKLSGGILELNVRNSVYGSPADDGGGIGLNNVQNRLRLVYPDRHKLAFIKENNMYTMKLQLDLNR